MTTKAAREEELGELHSKVAKIMTNALAVVEKAQDMFLEMSTEELLEKEVPTVSPPLLAVITKFLNDNSITCVPEEAAGVSELEQRMQRMREQRSKRNTKDNVVFPFPVTGTE